MQATDAPWTERWEVVKDLSRGGQGTTFLVKSREAGQEGVLKVLRRQTDAQARRRMFQEVGNLQVLHAADCKVPKLLDSNTPSFEDMSVPLYFVMEYVEGDTLHNLISKEGRLAVEVAIAIASDICQTTAKSLKNGIIHRDIKPQNIIMRSIVPADVVILDYGLSFNTETPDEVTRAGETIDNRFISLPERRVPGGDRRDPRSDLAGVCGIFFYCLTATPPVDLTGPQGEPPHRRKGSSLREALGNEPRVPALDALFDCGFAQRLDDRFQSAQELMDRLEVVKNPKARVTEVDPVTFATQSRERFVKYDRQTQLAIYGDNASMVFKNLFASARQLKNRLAPYVLETQHNALNDRIARSAPVGSDPIRGSDGFFLVRHGRHPIAGVICYKITAKGPQCVVSRLTISPRDPRALKGVDPSGLWEEICWFNGESKAGAADTHALLFEDAKACMVQVMTAIEEKVIGPTQ